LRQQFAGLWILVVAEFHKLIFFHPACKSKLFSPDSSPFTRHDVFLTVIIAELQMLFEVFFRVVQVALCFGGQHIHFLPHCAGKVVMKSLQPDCRKSV
jgi:hypothetical protein